MHKNKWPFEQAFEYAVKLRPMIFPNILQLKRKNSEIDITLHESFQEQLQLLEKMEYVVDHSHPELKNYLEDLRKKDARYTADFAYLYVNFFSLAIYLFSLPTKCCERKEEESMNELIIYFSKGN